METSQISPNQIVPTRKKPIDKMKEVLGSIPESLTGIISRFKSSFGPSEDAGVLPGLDISPRTKKVVTLAASLFFIIIIFLITISYIKNREEKSKDVSKEGSSAQTTIIERKPSRYATDSAVLNMETDTKVLEDRINKVEIEEKSLIPPNLNFDVNFEE